ncbi:MAG: tRNA uridine-5-carboxymethylaminomethyl(34) synthesis enzyme MnmG [Shimia sp.]
MKHHYDVIVVGGGHAGLEAAFAANRRGARTALITMKRDDIGALSCNPAIGGLGKGHLVREIDALGGVMSRLADAGGIQYRLLNASKGPAVRGPRAQEDRALYRAAAQALLDGSDINLVLGEVVDLDLERPSGPTVRLRDGSELRGRAVVVTTGTFLGARIHIGQESYASGRMGDTASERLADAFKTLGLELGRLKTGTPPRLRKGSINWDRVEDQPGDANPTFFSRATKGVQAAQVSCGITYTNKLTHQIITDNLAQSAMYSGNIGGVGPRYCPSIEDKVVRFADRDAHQVFLEPEGLTSDLVYPNGISTSLPLDVQAAYVQSIVGLEAAEIVQPGYAVEYGYVDPRGLNALLCLREVPYVFLAGQINGTTGYEEAAAQGLVAGANAAAAALDLDSLRPSRASSYLGVLVDDLTKRGVSEPYRMFTSRAEYRLSLRADNADLRLTTEARRLGLIGDVQWAAFVARSSDLDTGRVALKGEVLTDEMRERIGLPGGGSARKWTAYDALSQATIGEADLCAGSDAAGSLSAVTLESLRAEALYEPYIRRQAEEAERLLADQALSIPEDMDFSRVDGLSMEIRHKLRERRPSALADAAAIDGMTPAALLRVRAAIKASA